jgi:hypothetical protein
VPRITKPDLQRSNLERDRSSLRHAYNRWQASYRLASDPPPGRLPSEQYALPVKRLSTFIKRLAGRRPPTGPLTTAETTDAEELRQETLAKDEERLEREQKDASERDV